MPEPGCVKSVRLHTEHPHPTPRPPRSRGHDGLGQTSILLLNDVLLKKLASCIEKTPDRATSAPLTHDCTRIR